MSEMTGHPSARPGIVLEVVRHLPTERPRFFKNGVEARRRCLMAQRRFMSLVFPHRSLALLLMAAGSVPASTRPGDGAKTTICGRGVLRNVAPGVTDITFDCPTRSKRMKARCLRVPGPWRNRLGQTAG